MTTTSRMKKCSTCEYYRSFLVEYSLYYKINIIENKGPRLFVKTASIATLESQGDIDKKPGSGNAFDMQNRDPNTLNDYLQTGQFIEMQTEEHLSFIDLQTDAYPKKRRSLSNTNE
ncbi:hypothetical protein NPIL_263981 [Nephila pilipes]|uniref:Uncharacterized protein n=1 Tax=Nephila pilipes TaxID=299642 RepID=A0A8X6TWJ0_NEPPI|nr:hypothetical protein NPIL_263981 [Nephila pilipes]